MDTAIRFIGTGICILGGVIMALDIILAAVYVSARLAIKASMKRRRAKQMKGRDKA